MKLSPLHLILLKCIASVLREKSTLVRICDHLYDSQFLGVLGYAGFPTNTTILNGEMNFLEELGLIAQIDKENKYMGKSIHYIITKEGWDILN
jgi:hypothetical protein